MNYQELQRAEQILQMQFDMLTKMEEFIKTDEEYEKEHPEEELPPIVNIGVLKSHIITQKKACEGFLSITARHLPRMKKEHDVAVKAKTVIAKKSIPITPKAQNKAEFIPPPNIEAIKGSDSSFISLF